MRLYKFLFFTFLFALSFCKSAQASHIRAGDLIVERIDTGNPSSRLYRITVTLYRDVAGVAAQPGEINFGDGSDPVIVSPVSLGLTDDGQTEVLEYVVEHSFPVFTNYRVSYFERNRNGGIINMSNSLEVPFFIESQVTLSPDLGLNSTPEFEIPPLDQACTGQKFTHNPGAFDEQGDSLSYELTISRQGNGLVVPNYRFPDEFSTKQENDSVPDLFLIDEFGTLTWNAPEIAGEYNVAFFVNEWRNGRIIGKVNRDMQITVDVCNNERPNIDPKDTCIVAGMNLKGIIEATDADGDFINLTQEKAIPNNSATPRSTLTITESRAGFTSGEFEWQSRCEDVREQPYQAVFKAKEDRTDGLVELSELEVWRVKVVGPAPTGLTALTPDQVNRTIDLTWDPYSCPNADIMQIWRRRGSFDFALDTCEPGIPEGSGYELIDERPITETTYFDNNDGAGLERGTRYCYRLVAKFPLPSGGESLASFEVCEFIKSTAPYIMNVSVEETDDTDGEVRIVWTQPVNVSKDSFPEPWSYDLVRYEGANGTGTRTVLAQNRPQLDTTFLDEISPLNTEELSYSYRVLFYAGNPRVLIDSSQFASTVRLTPTSRASSIALDWSADVPWGNREAEFPYHYIFREFPTSSGTFELIDSVNVIANGFTYIDNGTFMGQPLIEDTVYRYYVSTVGGYSLDFLRDSLVNKSQIVRVPLLDINPPCDLILTVTGCGDGEYNQILQPDLTEDECNNRTFSNELSWRSVEGEGCDDTDIRKYQLYYSPTKNGIFDIIEERQDQNFLSYSHELAGTQAGCYFVRVFDEVESRFGESDTVCVENCPFYELPNSFSPNGDGDNDTFTPFKCPTFIKRVEFEVRSRWGDLVHASDDDIYLNWDGTNEQGSDLPTGVYYYAAKVIYNTTSGEEAVFSNLKGVIHLLRGKKND